jgi:hypothetical protein
VRDPGLRERPAQHPRRRRRARRARGAAHRARARAAPRAMSFRRRIGLLAGLAVALAVALACGLTYLTISHELHGQIDSSLRSRTQLIARRAAGILKTIGDRGLLATGVGAGLVQQRELRGGFDYVQKVTADGRAVPIVSAHEIRVDARTRAVAAGRGGAFLRDLRVDGEDVRVYVLPLSSGGALEIGRSLAETDSLLSRVRWILLAVSGFGVLLAALLGRLVRRGRSRRCASSPPPPTTSRRPATSRAASRSTATTRSPAWPRASTQCSTRSPRRCASSASSSPTRRTSCVRRSPACARTSRSCATTPTSRASVAARCSIAPPRRPRS